MLGVHCAGAKRTHLTPDMQLFKDSKIAERLRCTYSPKKKKRFAFSLNVESVDMTLNTFIST